MPLIAGTHHVERDRNALTALEQFVRRPLIDRSLFSYVTYRLRWALLSLLVLFVVSTLLYATIEHYSILGAAFFTVITLSTVGYGEPRPLSDSGLIITMTIIITSFGGLLYAATTLSSLFTSGDALVHLKQQRSRRMRNEFTDHVIVVGFGRVGQAVARGVVELGHQCLVIERNPDVEAAVTEAGCVLYLGDATAESDLVEAGITRAAALVAATEADATNLVITLTARAIHPGLRIVSRVNESDWQDRIIRAGANVAQSPYPSYGLSLAATAVSSSAVELHTLPAMGLAMEELAVEASSRFVGMTVYEIGGLIPNVVIIGIRRNAAFQRWTEVTSGIAPGDVVVALGPPEGVRDLATLA